MQFIHRKKKKDTMMLYGVTKQFRSFEVSVSVQLRKQNHQKISTGCTTELYVNIFKKTRHQGEDDAPKSLQLALGVVVWEIVPALALTRACVAPYRLVGDTHHRAETIDRR